MLKSKSHSLSVKIHFSINYNLRFNHLIVFKKSQSKVKIEIKSSFFHQLYQLRHLFLWRSSIEKDKNIMQTFFPRSQFFNTISIYWKKYLKSSIPYILLASGIFIRPGINLIGLNYLMHLVRS